MRKNRKYLVLIGILIFLFGAYFVADAILFNGIRPQQIQENGFQAKYFAQEATENKVAVLLVGGGQWGDYWAQEFARREMVGLSVPYTGLAGLPKLAEEIKLEYFENALNWLKLTLIK